MSQDKTLACMLAALLLLCPGCQRGDNGRKISAISGYNDVDMMTERVGMEETAYREHLDLSFNGTTTRDAQRQVELVEAAIQARRYGIALNAASPVAVNAAVHNALVQGIPVVILLHPILMQPSPHLHMVLEDPGAGAQLVTERLNTLTHGRGEVAVFGLNPLYMGSAERFQGMKLALRRDAPRMQVHDEQPSAFGNGYLEIAAEELVTAHLQLSAVVALNVESGLAAVAAVRAAHKQEQIHVIVFDASLQIFHLLRAGEVDSIVAQDARGMGSRAVQDILDDRCGKPAAGPVYLKPRLITRALIDHEDVQQFLLMKWRRP